MVRAIFSAAVGLLILAVVASIVVPEASYAAAVFAAIALVFGFPLVRRSQLVIGVVLLSVGVVTMVAAVLLGHEIVPLELLRLNQDIIGMLAAVAFLGFIARGVGDARPKLRGSAAVWRTALVTHLLGSVINLSAVTVVGDYLRRDGKLRDADIMIITRSFATAGFWSPLWAGAALALAFAPEANVGIVIAVGAPLAVIVLAVSMPTVFRALGDDLPNYRGYALSWQLLRIPLVILVMVLGLHFLLADVPVPRLVALSALIVCVIATFVQSPSGFFRNFAEEARENLPAVRGELVLFVSAGVMGLGLSALMKALDVTLPITSYSVLLAWAGVLVMTALVVVGIHQVITIGFIAALVMPLNPDPTLFMASVVIGWGASVAVGPLTGLQMYMQGRYNVNGIQTTKRNLPYLITGLVLSLPTLYLVDWIVSLTAG